MRWRAVKPLVIFLIVVAFSCKDDEPGPPPPDDTAKFTNPLLDPAPDPWVFRKDDWYYVMHTTGNSIRLYRTQKMSALKNAQVKTIWTPPSQGPNSKNIWAPELHFYDDKWYVYYAADDGVNEHHRMWALENTSADPFTGTWVDRGEVQLPDDKWAIDGTLFSHDGSLYFLWSGWEGDVNERQDIFIAKMSDPLTADGGRVRLSTPAHAWEMHGGPPYVNEAPQFLAGDEKIFVVYSASGCWTDEYSLGMLSIPVTSDLLDADAWTKSAEPVFAKNASSLAFGPGHNSFFKSADGTEDWLIYHANAEPGDGCGNERSLRMQKFSWTAGQPVFGAPVALGASLDVPSGESQQ